MCGCETHECAGVTRGVSRCGALWCVEVNECASMISVQV